MTHGRSRRGGFVVRKERGDGFRRTKQVAQARHEGHNHRHEGGKSGRRPDFQEEVVRIRDLLARLRQLVTENLILAAIAGRAKAA